MPWLIAQTAAPERISWTSFYGFIAIAVMLAIGLVVIVWVKRRSESAQDHSGPVLPFTLHDLRKLHEEGQLTDEEFEKARGRIVAMSKAALEKTPPSPQSPTAPPPGEKAQTPDEA